MKRPADLVPPKTLTPSPPVPAPQAVEPPPPSGEEDKPDPTRYGDWVKKGIETTINGKEAHVLIGDRIPVLTDKTSNGVSTSTVEYIEVGIKLEYTPSITADGTITAKVRTEVSTPTLVPDIKNYRITTREAESNVNMKDGETMVIAGLIGTEESRTSNKVPFLGDIPILGALFRSHHNTKSETEVVIFLTAKIVK